MKLRLLDFGNIDYDEGFPLAGAGVSTLSQPNPPAARRKVAIVGALIEHPRVGPILFDTGAAPNAKELWPAIVFELFAITHYGPENRIDNIVKSAGYDIKDIKANRAVTPSPRPRRRSRVLSRHRRSGLRARR